MSHDRSQELFERAKRCIPGGVNSPVRAFRSVGGVPRFIVRAHGAHIWDEDGREYVDYVGSWGPMILGHDHPAVRVAVEAALQNGTSFGAPTRVEVEMAEFLCERLPHLEMVRMVNSGTEATMSALRLARGFTGRDKIIKCSGCYHGHGDSLLVEAGSGALTFGTPSSPGVPASLAKDTVVVPFNDSGALQAALEASAGQVAAFIVEPVPGNMGVILPARGYLEEVRRLCSNHGVALIFDEVMTGFRVGFGGVAQWSGVTPDLATYGKVIGGGLPVGAYGGKREIMGKVSPSGPVYQAGTLSGNPLAMAAGLAQLGILWEKRADIYPRLEALTARLVDGLAEAAKDAGLPLWGNRIASMFTGFFQAGPVTDYASATKSDTARFGFFFSGMLDHGIYLAPSQYETGFVSDSHSESDIDRTLSVAREVMKGL
jgi:glutamate-1-semialdehyde 2,1-aminomutase